MSSETRTDSRSWPDLAIQLYERLSARDAEINYCFRDFEVWVPSSIGPGAEHAHWRLSGTMSIDTRSRSAAPVAG
ncbi:MAG: hypothetical protein ACOY3P_24590 [Planctomycetota bacterium]